MSGHGRLLQLLLSSAILVAGLACPRDARATARVVAIAMARAVSVLRR